MISKEIIEAGSDCNDITLYMYWLSTCWEPMSCILL